MLPTINGFQSWWGPALRFLCTWLVHALPLVAGFIAARRLPGQRPGSPGTAGLAAGIGSFLLVRDAAFSLSLGVDGPGGWQSASLQAAFLAGVLLPPFWAQWRPKVPPARRTLWAWAAGVGLHAAAEGWVVAAALAGEASLLGLAPLALRQLVVGGGMGLLALRGYRPFRWEAILIWIAGTVPAALAGWAYPAAAFSPWLSLWRAGAAGLLLAGLMGGRWWRVPPAGRRAEAELAFGLGLAGGLLLMGVLYQAQAGL